MKRILLLFTALLLSTNFLYSQLNPVFNWIPINSGTGNDLNYGNGNYITGTNGTLLYTSNSGKNWAAINTGSTGNLKSVQYLNANIIAVGNNGLILKSTNTGGSFSVVSSGTTGNLNSLSRIGATIYAAVGDGGLILRTANSGTNWSPVASGTTVNFNGIAGLGSVIAVGNNGTILRTTNTGLNWNAVTSTTMQNLNGVDILNNVAVAVGSGGTIVYSSDAGATWQSAVSGTSAELNAVKINGNTVFVSGNNVVLKSTNGGASWSTISDILLPNNNWKAVYTYNDNEAYVAGSSGVIYRKILDTLYSNQFAIDANNMKSYIWKTGVFNQNLDLNNSPGCEWINGTDKFAIFTTGLTTAAYVNGSIRMASASYNGELLPGYTQGSNYQTDSRFKLYKVDADRTNDSDYINWDRMVPFGAPFDDVNNNGIYDEGVDKPGIKGAKQTVFICMSDANPTSHSPTEGFGGGTAPLGAEYHMTAWAYNVDPYKDMIFFKWAVINKSNSTWDSTIFSLVADPDLGDAVDDYIGCDTIRSLAYSYNADNNDGNGSGVSYGLNPPAVGTMFLNCSGGNSLLSSMSYYTNSASPGPTCETDPENPIEAYNIMKGLKTDGTQFVIPNTNPPQISKYVYSGDPEANTGWTEYQGRVENCGGSLTGTLVAPTQPGDRRTVMNYKSTDLTMNPGDTQVVVIAQLIARGSNHKNSVTMLKQAADLAQILCSNGFVIGVNTISSEVPVKYGLHQNYPNPFNPVTKIKFDLPKQGNVTVRIYDAIGREITTLVNEQLKAGVYSVDWDASNYPSGVYFYKLQSNDFTQTKKMVLVK